MKDLRFQIIDRSLLKDYKLYALRVLYSVSCVFFFFLFFFFLLSSSGKEYGNSLSLSLSLSSSSSSSSLFSIILHGTLTD